MYCIIVLYGPYSQLFSEEYVYGPCGWPPYLYGGKGPKREELGHPQLKVEAEAVEERPDIDDLAGSQPQGGDSKCADCGQELSEDAVVVPAQVVVDVSVVGDKAVTQSAAPLYIYIFLISHKTFKYVMQSEFVGFRLCGEGSVQGNPEHSLAKPVIYSSVKMPVNKTENYFYFHHIGQRKLLVLNQIL